MKTLKLFLIGTLFVALFMVTPAMAFVPTFTGNVETDFPAGPGVLIVADPGGQEISVTGQPGGGLTPGSGWDIKDLRLAYDNVNDILYVGLNSYNIVGDADGDGDPGSETWGGGVDFAELASTETVAVYFDLDMVGPFSMSTSWDVIVGVGDGMIFSDFGIFNTDSSGNPSANFGSQITGHYGLTPIDPDVTHPDWEFSITDFSTLLADSDVGTDDAVPGAFRVGAFMGSIEDGSIGEDYIYYHQIPSTIVTITPSSDTVIEGETVSLEVTEENDSEALAGQILGPGGTTVTMPYGFFPAAVAVTQNGSPISGSPFGAPPDSGDTANTTVLDIGEIWTWGTVTTITSDPINATTTFVAHGSGTGPQGFVHTYVEDSDEEAQAEVEILSTDVSISASATAVGIDGTVDLTVTEHNDGDEDLTNVSVAISYDNGGGPTSLVTLIAPPTSGDTGGDGILGVGETWTWDATTVAALNDIVISSTTTFTATGSADYDDGVNPVITVTYPGDADEQDEVTVVPLSTDVGISASSTTVPIGGTVDLTVTEHNDGDEDLTNVSVAVTFDNGGGSTPLVILTASPTSGDTGNDGILGVGETWTWDATTEIALNDFAITATTIFTATGSAQYDDGVNPIVTVTYPGDLDEQDSVTVTPSNPGTSISIVSDNTLVCEGDTVTLTICEQNDGQIDLTNVAVVVYYDDGGGETLLVALPAAPDSGDTADTGVLNQGETWCWDVADVPVDVSTTFIAYGYGEFGDFSVTWCENPASPPTLETFCDQDERDEVTVDTQPCGGEGCTPGFWKNNADKHEANAWDCYSPNTKFSTVFGETITIFLGGNPKKSSSYLTDPTLFEALGANGGGINALARHGVSALLNACSDCVDYSIPTPGAVIDAVHDAIESGEDAIDALHEELAGYNEAGCPIDQQGRCSHPID
jgi:hypothetical protein